MPSLAVDAPPPATPAAWTPAENRVRRLIAGLFFVIVLPGIVLIITAIEDFRDVFFEWLKWSSLGLIERVPEHWRPWIMAWFWAIYLSSVALWVGWFVAERLRSRGGVGSLMLAGAMKCCGWLALLTGVALLPLIIVMPGLQTLFWTSIMPMGGPWNFLFLVMYRYLPIALGISGMGLAMLAPFGCGFTLWHTASYANSLCGGGVRVGAVCGFMLALALVATLTVAFC